MRTIHIKLSKTEFVGALFAVTDPEQIACCDHIRLKIQPSQIDLMKMGTETNPWPISIFPAMSDLRGDGSPTSVFEVTDLFDIKAIYAAGQFNVDYREVGRDAIVGLMKSYGVDFDDQESINEAGRKNDPEIKAHVCERTADAILFDRQRAFRHLRDSVVDDQLGIVYQIYWVEDA